MGVHEDRGDLAVADRAQFNSLERAERDRWERHELAELEASRIAETIGEGRVLVSERADEASLLKLGVDP